MGQYRKKPVWVEAMQFTGDNGKEIAEFVGTKHFLDSEESASWIYIHTLEGNMQANVGDWIIKGVKGEFYPCRDDIFQATYEAVDADA